jgi:glycosyltransferase involved in cell wall biosynthesis
MTERAALRVLHLCSDYAKQHVYLELVSHLDALGIAQFVYVPVRSAAELGVNQDDSLRCVRFTFSHVLRPWHRLLFRTKVRTVLRDVLDHVDVKTIDLVHAHFLYSDGAVALKLNERYGLPYVVTVRNTDVNVFMRYRPDLERLCWKVIANARNVVFITPAYLELVIARAPRAMQQILRRKARIVPNGVASYWIEQAPPRRLARKDGKRLRLLYVGDFSRNKNLATTIRAAEGLNAHSPTGLTLVGGGGDGEKEVDALLSTGAYPFVTRLPRIQDRDRLAAVYREHDIFVMPSLSETFGVVYIEALSQGLPIVHTRGQGVDGYFAPKTVAEAADPHDVASVQSAVSDLAARLDAVREECVRAARAFGWPFVAQTYAGLYGNAVAGHDA